MRLPRSRTNAIRNLDLKAKLFRGLADSSRLAIVESLRAGPRCVSDVVRATGLSQPSASMHLDCLWCCGLVERETRGRFTWYRLRPRRVARLLAAAEDLLAVVGRHVEACGRYREGRRAGRPSGS
ncbi:MAG: winged helix-turn-helix transcriptional regulator [Planctomycetes bacterium]|nr:winged helix-turn-helix transcriptional regulator [Planctomycetota bacterium]